MDASSYTKQKQRHEVGVGFVFVIEVFKEASFLLKKELQPVVADLWQSNRLDGFPRATEAYSPFPRSRAMRVRCSSIIAS